MTDIARWLNEHGLGKYVEVFHENEIDFDVLEQITLDELKELGIPLGARKRILNAVATLVEIDGAPSHQIETPIEPARSAAGEVERRQLTIMFADIVGSTELSSRLDPEELRELNLAYQDAAKASIEEYEGYVGRYMGDGVLAYFGYPQAHENDAERAVRAGLGLVKRVSQLDTTAGLAVRVGIATGPVVVGDLIGEGVAQEHAVVGETPNLAARLQGLANPNAVVLAESTKRLVEGHISLEFLGAQRIRGLPQPVGMYRADHVLEGGRFVSEPSTAMAPLVGRMEELNILLRRWSLARSGEGQVVLLEGEPGIGKSRIIDALRLAAVQETSCTVLRYHCSPYHSTSAFHPIVEQLSLAAGFRSDDEQESRLDKLEALLGSDATSAELALLAELLSLPATRYQIRDVPATEKRAETILALSRQLENLARSQPVLMFFEDLHWCDPSTADMLDFVIANATNGPVMVVATYRPEFQSPWTAQGHVTSLGLNRLSRDDVRAICRRVSRDKELPEEVLEYIHQRTDGVPLFAEELTKDLLESEHLEETDSSYRLLHRLPSLSIPSTVKDALTARLDRLGPAKHVAQVGSVVGRTFALSDIVEMTGRQASEFSLALDRLSEVDLVTRRGMESEATFTFRHALIRDAAYDSLLIAERKRLHAQAATLYSNTNPVNYALVANHHELAGAYQEAVSNYVRAGRRAAQRAEHDEAARALEGAVELCTKELSGRDQLDAQLAIELARGAALISQTSYGNPAVGTAYRSAANISRALANNNALFSALRGEWTHLFTIADLRGSLDKADELLAMASHGNMASVAIAQQLRGQSLLTLGNFLEAKDAFCTSIELADEIAPGGYGQDASVFSRTFGAIAQWALGFGEISRNWSSDGLSIAKQMDSPFILGQGYMHTMLVAPVSFGKAGTFDLTEEVQTFTENGTFGNVEPYTRLFRAWSDPKGGDTSVVEARDAAEVLDQLGAVVGRSSRLLHLAQCELANQSTEDARNTIHQALEFCSDVEEFLWFPEVLRLAAAIESRTDRSAAESLLLQALDFSRERAAKGHELRVSLELARLRRASGNTQGAKVLLEPIVAWFQAGGHVTSDVGPAASLLEALAQG